MSADQCWKSCCCRTKQQNIAWAKSHGVDIPAYVLAAANLDEKPAKSCCSKQSKTKPCCTKEDVDGDACLTKRSCSVDANSSHAACDRRETKPAASRAVAKSKSCCQTTEVTHNGGSKPEKRSRWKWVNGVSAAKCHGLAYDWMLAGLCDVPPVVCCSISIFQTGWVTTSPAIFCVIEESPAIPPPRAPRTAILA